MKRSVSLLARAAVLLFALAIRQAAACSCSGQGPTSALTREDQTWAVRVSERLVLAQGAFGARAEYAAFRPTEHDRTLAYTLVAAYRPAQLRSLELASSFEYGRRAALIAAESGQTAGFGDVITRARWEAVHEPPPWQGSALPSLALLLQIRWPTGNAVGLTPLGNGATEVALGAALERTLGERWRVGLLAEIAPRLADRALGYARQLGPRANGELTLSWFATRELVLSALANLRWEGNVSVQGRSQSGTAQRTSELGAALAWQPASAAFRAGITERYAPPLGGWGANTNQNLSCELWLAFAH